MAGRGTWDFSGDALGPGFSRRFVGYRLVGLGSLRIGARQWRSGRSPGNGSFLWRGGPGRGRLEHQLAASLALEVAAQSGQVLRVHFLALLEVDLGMNFAGIRGDAHRAQADGLGHDLNQGFVHDLFLSGQDLGANLARAEGDQPLAVQPAHAIPVDIGSGPALGLGLLRAGHRFGLLGRLLRAEQNLFDVRVFPGLTHVEDAFVTTALSQRLLGLQPAELGRLGHAAAGFDGARFGARRRRGLSRRHRAGSFRLRRSRLEPGLGFGLRLGLGFGLRLRLGFDLGPGFGFDLGYGFGFHLGFDLEIRSRPALGGGS